MLLKVPHPPRPRPGHKVYGGSPFNECERPALRCTVAMLHCCSAPVTAIKANQANAIPRQSVFCSLFFSLSLCLSVSSLPTYVCNSDKLIISTILFKVRATRVCQTRKTCSKGGVHICLYSTKGYYSCKLCASSPNWIWNTIWTIYRCLL